MAGFSSGQHGGRQPDGSRATRAIALPGPIGGAAPKAAFRRESKRAVVIGPHHPARELGRSGRSRGRWRVARLEDNRQLVAPTSSDDSRSGFGRPRSPEARRGSGPKCHVTHGARCAPSGSPPPRSGFVTAPATACARIAVGRLHPRRPKRPPPVQASPKNPAFAFGAWQYQCMLWLACIPRSDRNTRVCCFRRRIPYFFERGS